MLDVKLKELQGMLYGGLGDGGSYETVPLRYDEIRVACAQIDPQAVDLENPEEGIQANLEKMLHFVDIADTWPPHPNGVQLVVFPEFAINGLDTRYTLEELQRVCISIDGAEIRAIGEKAKERDCYISFANYSQDPDWPGKIFNLSMIVGPDGNLIHKHIKAYYGITGGFEWATTVHDILDEFVERYGWEAVWPVARTDIGNIGTYVCSEGFAPETARALAMNGAEILVRNTAHCAGSPFNGDNLYVGDPEVAFQADCGANHCFGIFANSNGPGVVFDGVKFAPNMQGAGSRIIDPYGHVKTRANDSREQVLYTTIPIASHRKQHRVPMLRKELYAPMYEKMWSPIPPNLHSEHVPADQLESLKWSLKHKR